MPKIFDVVSSAGSYKNAEGEDKTRWIKCGMVVKNAESGKMSLKLDCIPVGKAQDENDHGIWFALMEPRPYQPAQARPSAQNPEAMADDKIPF
jgi:hypothetical protein